MAAFTLDNTPFPEGTTVGVYKAEGYSSAPATPPGSAVTTAVVTGGTVTFSGLTDHVPYFAFASVGGVWESIRFQPGENGPPPRFPDDADFATLGPNKVISTNAAGTGYEFVDVGTQAELDVATADIKVIKEAPLNVEYPEYGADGTGVADSITAFNKAIAALPAQGGEIRAERLYTLSDKLNLEVTRAVKFSGQAGLSGGATPASQLIFTQGGSGPLIAAGSAVGLVWADLSVCSTSKSFTGPAFDVGSNGSGQNTASRIERSLIVTNTGTGTGILADKTADLLLLGVEVEGFDTLIQGKVGDTDQSIGVQMVGGVLSNAKTIPVLNPGYQWQFRGTVVEALVSGAAGFVDVAVGMTSIGLHLDDVWMGDANTKGTWVLYRGRDLGIDGGTVGGGALGVSIPDATSDVVVIKRVEFAAITGDAIVANFGAKTQHYDINPNTFGVTGKKVSLDNGATDAGAGPLSN